MPQEKDIFGEAGCRNSDESMNGQALGVYEGFSLKLKQLLAYSRNHRINWPLTPSGRPASDDDTFRKMAAAYPKAIGPLYEIRSTLAHLEQLKLTVGDDGRNRCWLNPFGTVTSRNAPSTVEYVFGPAKWIRSLIKPRPGTAVSDLDWSAQEIGIGAYLSEDANMIQAYQADPYLWLAKRGGYAPASATKVTHASVRDTFKVVYLATNYRMGKRLLAQKINRPLHQASLLLRLVREEFPVFWAWSEAALEYF